MKNVIVKIIKGKMNSTMKSYFIQILHIIVFFSRTVSNYLLWRFVKNRVSNLGEAALQAKQEYIKVLFGRKTQPER